MTDRQIIDRRSFLGSSAALGGFGLACSGASGGVFAAEGDAPLKTTLLTSAGTTSLVFYALMQQEGFFHQMGVDPDVQAVSDGSKIIAALVGGSGDMCAGSGFSSLFPAIEKGAKIKIISGALLSPVTCIYSSKPDIKSAKDLIGKSVGTGAPGALLHELVVALLVKKGIDYKQVNFVNIGSGPDVFKAVAAGTIDAGPGEVDFFDQQQKYGVHALTDGALWDELPEYTNQAMLASERAISEKRDVIVRCLAAYAKMYRFIQDPTSFDAWRKARATALGRDDQDEALTQWKFYQKPNRLAADLVLTQTNTDYVQKLNVLLGVQKAVLPFDQLADMSLARDALKLRG